MIFSIALLSVALAVTLVIFWRKSCYWRQIERGIQEVAAGRRPATILSHSWDKAAALRGLHRIAKEQRRLRSELAEEEFNLAAIFASMVEGVMVTDERHTIRLVNDAFTKLFQTPDDPRGRTVLASLREASVEELVAMTLETGHPQSREMTLVQTAEDEPLRHLEMNAVPIRDDDTTRGVVAVFHDITRLRQLEEIRRQFVANVSHELRTPLTVFQGHLENLLDDPEMPREELKRVLEVMRKNSARLGALIDDLLTLARLEARQQKLSRESIDLAQFIEETISEWKPKAQKIEIATRIPQNMPPLYADPSSLHQVLGNLLDNAVKYTSEGGRITIGAEPRHDELLLYVQDNGIGIPPQDLPRIFERFYRVEKARSRDSGGTGLGLSIVKHVAALHGGSVEAESTPGEGTKVTVHFPQKPTNA